MARKKAVRRRTAQSTVPGKTAPRPTVGSVKGELDAAVERLKKLENASPWESDLGSLQDDLTRVEDQIRDVPEFDDTYLDPLRTLLDALTERLDTAESRLAEAESKTKEADDAAAAASSSGHSATREVGQLRSHLHLTWGIALVLAIVGFFCWHEKPNNETSGPPATAPITSGMLLAIDISTDSGDWQRVFAKVRNDGTIEAVSDEVRLNVAGLEFDLARRLLEAHVRTVAPKATAAIRAATDEEKVVWDSVTRTKRNRERDDDREEEEEEELDDD